MNRKRLLVLALVFLPLLANAAETVTLTLDDAVRLALDNSINLKKDAIDLAEAGYSASHLWSEIFPSFSLSTTFTFLPQTPLVTDPGFKYRDDALSYTVSLGLSLPLNPYIYSSMKRIELAYRTRLLSYENASKLLEIQVIKRFLNLIAMNANISNMQGSLDLALQKMNNDRIARANGLLSELLWLDSQLRVETARYSLLTAQNSYKNSLGEFLAILGIDDGTNVILNVTAGTVEIAKLNLDPEKLIMEHLPKRPDIVTQRQTIERLELNKNFTTNNSRSPTLNLSTTWGGSGGPSTSFTDSIRGSLTLSIPIDSWIPGTKANQSIRAVNAEVEKARLELQNTETQAKNQIRLLVSNLNSRWESLEIARLRVSIAQRTVDAYAIGFRNGTVEFKELEDKRSDLSNASQRLLEEELTYQSLLLDLAVALNVDWRSLTGQSASGVSGSQK